jgi:catechol 2,3-dioxygenase-like lactoylglutathione lyase family enzyme
MDYKLEVIMIPATDVDRSLAFYSEGCGFHLDVDYEPNRAFRVVQLTPPGSGCSIQIGRGLTDAKPGTARNACLVVDDIETARSELAARGVGVGPVEHKTSAGDWQGDTTEGIDPARRDYASFADPDGNTWTLQEVRHPNAGSDQPAQSGKKP